MTTPVAPRRALPAGVGFAVGSALLFGLSTPCAKTLVGGTQPLLLAGLLYAGSGLGLLAAWLATPSAGQTALTRRDVPWLAGAVIAGGILGPVLLMSGLRTTPASSASLLLNFEGLFTALLAWFVFHENFDRRIAIGFVLIVAGGIALSGNLGPDRGVVLPLGGVAIVAACLAWAVDNNLTQRISGADPVGLAALKGGSAAVVNLTLAVATGARWPAVTTTVAALTVGLLGYGVSLALFVVALRHLGTARTGAYFSLAPFFGTLASLLLLREPVTTGLLAAGLLMAAGVYLHLTEHHEHEHQHAELAHSHSHVHDDDHHQHAHAGDVVADEAHTHHHVHEATIHWHPHYPDIHHRHRHG